MKLDHIIIGMGRCGTTSLSDYINQHPHIANTVIKEVHFFSVDDHYQRGETFLQDHFNLKTGSFTTTDTYLLMSDKGPERVYKHNPDIKITVLLRDPTSRTYSNYHYSLNNGYQKSSIGLIESLKKEKEFLAGDIILKNNLCHFEGSLYHKLLCNWLKYFGQDQIQILRTEDLQKTPQKVIDQLSNFLEIPRFQITPLEAKNKAKKVKSKALQQFLLNRNHWLRNLIRRPMRIKIIKSFVIKTRINDRVNSMNKKYGAGYPPMTEQEKEFCSTFFMDDLKKLKDDFNITL